jgi:hypothetical protein
MRDPLGDARQRLAREIDFHSAQLSEPIVADSWIVSSLMQKSIRRGETKIAQSAALTLLKLRGSAIWQRFMVIAFEDVGVGFTDAVIKVMAASSDAALRKTCGGDARVAAYLAGLMADAPKDRSTDYLVSAAQHQPACREFDARCSLMSRNERIEVLADFAAPLEFRSVTALCLSGMRSESIRERGAGNLEELANIYRSLGGAADFVAAAVLAAKKTREPITILAPLIWLEVARGGQARVSESVMPETKLVDGIPLYAFDKHTRLGKRAIRELVGMDAPLQCFLQEFLPRARWQAAVEMAAFYADAAPVARRLEWPLSHAIESLGTEADFFKAGVPKAAIQPLQAVMTASLGKLNEIRKALWLKARASVGAGEGA